MAKSGIKIKIIYFLLLVTLGLLVLLSIGLGKVNLFDLSSDISRTILINIRLPRIILGVVVGAALSISGVVLQGLLNNPLADSYTLGVSSGAAFGACLAIYLNIAFATNIPIQILAVTFAALVLYLVLWISKSGGRSTTANLVLSGIIVGSTCQAGISFLKSVANENAASMVYWLLGSLAAKSLTQVIILAVFITASSVLCFRYSRELNIMTLGRKEAMLVGVSYDKINKLLLITSTVMTAACVSLCGIIGFVGLVVPHVARLIAGADNRKVMPLSALLGAILLLGADTISRTLLKYELPVGVITTMIGGPFFCYIFISKNRRVH